MEARLCSSERDRASRPNANGPLTARNLMLSTISSLNASLRAWCTASRSGKEAMSIPAAGPPGPLTVPTKCLPASWSRGRMTSYQMFLFCFLKRCKLDKTLVG